MPRTLRLTTLVGPLFLLAACDGTPAAPAPPNPDEAIECLPDGVDAGADAFDGGARLGCASGEICLQGRCYAPCGSDVDCGPRETCGADGVCSRRAGPDPDGGMLDGGGDTPCTGVECAAPLVCHPLSGQCVECSEESIGAGPGEPGYCSGLRPICDIANGRCVEAGPAQCAPCNDDAECVAGTFTGRCVERTVMDVTEQVCLLPCAMPDGGASDASLADGGVAPSCPTGSVCDAAAGVCVPPAGATCTTWRAAVDGQSCFDDTACNPLGASAAFFPGACEGEMAPGTPDAGMSDAGAATDGGTPADAGPGTPGVCVQPCGVDAHCVDTTRQCLGSGAVTFCLVPPATP